MARSGQRNGIARPVGVAVSLALFLAIEVATVEGMLTTKPHAPPQSWSVRSSASVQSGTNVMELTDQRHRQRNENTEDCSGKPRGYRCWEDASNEPDEIFFASLGSALALLDESATALSHKPDSP